MSKMGILKNILKSVLRPVHTARFQLRFGVRFFRRSHGDDKSRGVNNRRFDCDLTCDGPATVAGVLNMFKISLRFGCDFLRNLTKKDAVGVPRKEICQCLRHGGQIRERRRCREKFKKRLEKPNRKKY